MAKNKILALILGPLGVGIISQLNTFNLLVSNFASFGMNVGVVRYVSKYNSQKRKKEISILLTTAIRVILFSSIVFVLLGLFFSKRITGFIFDDVKLSNYLVIILIGLPFFVLYNFCRSFLRGMLEIKKYVLVGIFSSIAGFLILFPLVTAFQLDGAIWHLNFYAVVSFLIAYYFYKKLSVNFFGQEKKKPKFDFKVLKELSKFGLASLAAGNSTIMALLFVKTLIVKSLNLYNLGIFQAVFSISAQSIQVIIEAIGTYSFPLISGLNTHTEIRKEINNTFRLAVLLATTSIFWLVILKNFVILLLFSSEFLPAAQILGIQLFGDFFKVVGWSMGVALLPLKRLKAFVVIDVIWSVLFVCFSYILIPKIGLKGAVFAYFFSYLFHAAANYLYLRKTIGFGFLIKNIYLLVSSIALLTFVVFAFKHSLQSYLIAGLLFLLWAVFAITREEFNSVFRIIGTFKTKFLTK